MAVICGLGLVLGIVISPWRRAPEPASNIAEFPPVALRPPTNAQPPLADTIAEAGATTAGAPSVPAEREAEHPQPFDRDGAAQEGEDPEKARFDAVEAWAKNDPRRALDWALAQNSSNRTRALQAVANGVVTQPMVALAIAQALLARDAESGGVFGTMLTAALGEAGEFSTGLQLAVSAPSDLGRDWLAALFRRWGESRPEDAAAALPTIADPASRSAATQAFAAGWAERDPAALARHAFALPPNPERDQALSMAILKWGERAPSDLAQWLGTLPRGPEFDAAAVVLVTLTDQANRPTEVARGWAESIADEGFRREATRFVLAEAERAQPAGLPVSSASR